MRIWALHKYCKWSCSTAIESPTGGLHSLYVFRCSTQKKSPVRISTHVILDARIYSDWLQAIYASLQELCFWLGNEGHFPDFSAGFVAFQKTLLGSLLHFSAAGSFFTCYYTSWIPHKTWLMARMISLISHENKDFVAFTERSFLFVSGTYGQPGWLCTPRNFAKIQIFVERKPFLGTEVTS